ncbi:MAG: NADH-quinone oxidoreductase subunit H [Acidobacteria bacterium]|nr:NADH-quinone oxidoreductase subunit H [Acidobacteriota bacterium]
MRPILLQAFLHVILVLTVPPLLLGIINKTKAFFGGRAGQPLLQAYYDLIKLLQKEMVLSRTTTWVFLAGPVIGLVTVLGASLVIPLGHHSAPVSFDGDMVLLAYLLGMGRFFTASAALDTGSAFEGMGAAREVSFACLAEPALFLGLMAMAKLTHSINLTTMFGGSYAGNWGLAAAPLVLVTASWFLVLLAENSRIPFDDPNTHLELTMIHEVMVLDHSGPALGLILYGAAIKLFLFAALVLNLAVPIRPAHPVAAWGLFLVSLWLLAVLIGVIESIMARLRLVNIPKLLVSACLLSAFGVILLVR